MAGERREPYRRTHKKNELTLNAIIMILSGRVNCRGRRGNLLHHTTAAVPRRYSPSGICAAVRGGDGHGFRLADAATTAG